LRRLGTDYIDVYYAHFPDPDTPLEQTLVVYDDLVRQGKLRYVALSNHPAWQVTQALWIADDRHLAPRRSARRSSYNVIDRAAEDELVPACQQFGLSIVPFGPLHRGCWPACSSSWRRDAPTKKSEECCSSDRDCEDPRHPHPHQTWPPRPGTSCRIRL
jgi:aryl-alcohol dehydrogenase-like predicted oxidoreductase